jgi:MYXO-CTERM domain-containing protein
MRRSVVGVGLLVAAACGQTSSGDAARIGTAKQDLIAYDDTVNPHYLGDDLGDHEIALTFDDGPGPMEVTGALAQWLHDHKDPKTGAPAPIRATFFVLGACIKTTTLSSGAKNQACDEPTPDADAVLAKVASLGHYIGNHTTTHRVMTSISKADMPEELIEVDGLISKYLIWNRMFFRAPTGAWNATVFNAIKSTAMNKYVGPIYWNVGGGGGDPPVTDDQAADWACWGGPNGDGTGTLYSTQDCGDRYITELRAVGNKGIILMHDAKGDTDNHDLTTAPGNTFDMLKYIIGEIEKDDTPWKFKRLDEVPEIAARLPKCDASCAQCSGPESGKCTECTPDKHLDNGQCLAGAPMPDGGADDDDGGASSSTTSSTSSSSGSSVGHDNASSSSGDAEAPAAEPAADDGCNASSRGGGGNANATAMLLALAALTSLRPRKRRG